MLTCTSFLLFLVEAQAASGPDRSALPPRHDADNPGHHGDTAYDSSELRSEEFVSKWLGNVSDVELRAEWSSWKGLHGKRYSSSVQDLERYVVWRSNMAYINYHNSFASNFGFYLAMNKFGDLVSVYGLYVNLAIPK